MTTNPALTAIEKAANVSARQKLELSRLTPGALQREGMGTDVELTKLALYLSSQVRMNIADRITDATISRTIDGSSLLTVVINDYDRAVLTSGLLANNIDIQVDGLWFRLTGGDKAGDDLTLTFEDREIAVLRGYSGWKVANRQKVTRAEFVLNLIREVKQFQIPVIIPELGVIQPIERYPGDPKGIDNTIKKGKGIPTDWNAKVKPNDKWWTATLPQSVQAVNSQTSQSIYAKHILTVKGATATKEQLTNANIILGVGELLGLERKYQVCAIMAAIDESTLVNNPGGDGTSVGLFQQIDQGWGTYSERYDPETSSRMFYKALVAEDKRFPTNDYGTLVANVQQPKVWQEQHISPYTPYTQEAEHFVTVFGSPGANVEIGADAANGSTANGAAANTFYYWRGNIKTRNKNKFRTPENTWDCIQRLADEVDWRGFFVSGVFYFISDDDLFKQQPALVMNEFDDGIIDVSGDYNRNKRSATVTITANVGRWLVPPGQVVMIINMGPWSGRWLVTEYERSLFKPEATITLSKPRPQLPEPLPASSNATDVQSSWLPKADVKKSAPVGNVTTTQITELAQELLGYYGNGWHDDNGKGYQQIWDTAHGKKVYGALGPQDFDYRVLGVILWLIKDQNYTIGTFAWNSDHHDDGIGGHSGGYAVDISSINGVAIKDDTPQCRALTLKVATLLSQVTGDLHPRQLITGGYGNHSDMELRALCILNAQEYAAPDDTGVPVIDQHENHIHVGY